MKERERNISNLKKLQDIEIKSQFICLFLFLKTF